MSMFDFDKIVDRKDTDSFKWQKYQHRDILPMWVADMDFPSPPAVIEALHHRIDHGVFGYGLPDKSLKGVVCNHLLHYFDWRIEPSWITWLPGLVSGLNVTCRATGRTGSGVLTTTPIYPPFLTAPQFSQCRLMTTALQSVNERWQIDFDDLKSKIDSDTSLFLLCNPQNPTGRVFTKAELLALADVCIKHDLIICSDEIHCDLVLDPHCRHRPIASLDPDIEKRTITLMAPSKTFNIPGLSCSYAIIADGALRRRFKQAMDGIVPHVNILGLVAARAAYENGRPWLAALIDYLRGNLDRVKKTLEHLPGLEMATVEATYLAWIDARSLNVPYPGKFFEKAGVGLSDGSQFRGDGFVRLNFGCPRALLNEGLSRMSKAMDDL